MRVERFDSALGQVSQPTVIQQGGILEISGTVQPAAPPTTRPAVRPHVELLFVCQGKAIGGFWLGLSGVSYSVRYRWSPPPGTTLQIAYVADQHPPTSIGSGGGAVDQGPGMVGYGAPGGPAFNGPVGGGSGRVGFFSTAGYGGASGRALGSRSPGYGGGHRHAGGR